MALRYLLPKPDANASAAPEVNNLPIAMAVIEVGLNYHLLLQNFLHYTSGLAKRLSSWHTGTLSLLAICGGNPPVTSLKPSDAEHLCFLSCYVVSQQAVEQTSTGYSRPNDVHIDGFYTLRPRQDGCHFADDISTSILLNENGCILITFSLKYVRKGPIENNPALVQIMAWRRSDDKPLSEPMMVSLFTYICVTRPQWVNARKAHVAYALELRLSHAHSMRLTIGVYYIKEYNTKGRHPGTHGVCGLFCTNPSTWSHCNMWTVWQK